MDKKNKVLIVDSLITIEGIKYIHQIVVNFLNDLLSIISR